MILEKITISNYKSIKKIDIPVKRINGSLTFSFLGINESGKSNILKAISFFENADIKFPLDFHNPEKPVEISFNYKLENFEKEELAIKLEKSFEAPNSFVKKINIEAIELKKSFTNNSNVTETKKEIISFKPNVINGYKLENNKIIQEKDKEINIEDFFKNSMKDYFWGEKHSVIFWKSEAKYLISGPINLSNFGANPKSISVPLLNCFALIGIEEKDILNEIGKLVDPTSITNLVDKLNDKVTEHINQIWKGHPIKIKFNINNNNIYFLVEDTGVKYATKLTTQRSDGFRQFISFLLTLSIEKSNDSLSYTILLLDEPETHLHPTAQLNLKEELLNISSELDSNNIVFYATHSSYLIDKMNLNRAFKVVKSDNVNTTINQIHKTETSYSEINYEIFDIPTNDYHNELFGFLEEHKKIALNEIEKDRDWYNEKSKKYEKVSIAQYVRHSIHHPENTRNKKFREDTLRKSISILRNLKYDQN